ncbi:MAG TPA: SgcJ/EcaC family oxidoreductase [Archangium sp.]
MLASPAHAQAAKGRGADEAALRKLVADQTEAWNRSDAAAWSKDFSQDAAFINIVGSVFNGREEIEKRHAFVFNTLFKGSRTEVTVTRLLFLDTAVAVVDMEHVVTGYAGLPPGVQATESGVLKTRMRYVMKKSGKKWEIVAGQNTDVKPAPAAAPTKDAPAGK